MNNRWAQYSPVEYSQRRQSGWVLADYDGKDLWKKRVLSLEWMRDGGWEWSAGGRWIRVTPSGEWLMQGLRDEAGSWFQRWGDVSRGPFLRCRRRRRLVSSYSRTSGYTIGTNLICSLGQHKLYFVSLWCSVTFYNRANQVHIGCVEPQLQRTIYRHTSNLPRPDINFHPLPCPVNILWKSKAAESR